MRSLIKKHPKWKKFLIAIPAVFVLLATQAESCDGSTPDPDKGAGKEQTTKLEQQDTVIEKQPAEIM